MKISLLIVFAFSIFAVNAQDSVLPDPEAYFSAIIVEDMDRSLAWYTEILGFEIINKQESANAGYQVANLKRAEILLEILELERAISPKTAIADYNEKTLLQGIFKTGFLVAEFDKWVVHLKDMGVTFRGDVVKDPVTSRRMLIILDPDGNRIQLFEK